MLFLKHEAAFEWIKANFKGRIDHVDYKNHNRHMVLYLKDGQIYYCLFKREFIHSFNYKAKELLNKYPDLAGYGESINVEWCMWAKSKNAKLLYIYENGKTYLINPNTVQNISVTIEQQQTNKYIENGMHIIKNEKEHWFPVKLLIPVEI
jgi:hypothetical protein